jgi:hypothetical protein
MKAMVANPLSLAVYISETTPPALEIAEESNAPARNRRTSKVAIFGLAIVTPENIVVNAYVMK